MRSSLPLEVSTKPGHLQCLDSPVRQNGVGPATLVRIAAILDVTLDEIVGRTEPSSDFGMQNPRLHELYQGLNGLSDEDQKALVIFLDSLIKRSQMGRVLAP